MRAKEAALGFGVAILLPMLVYYGISVFVPAPKPDYAYDNDYQINDTLRMEKERKILQLREDYRNLTKQNPSLAPPQSRLKWQEMEAHIREINASYQQSRQQEQQKMEQARQKKMQAFKDARGRSQQVLFWVSLPVGLIAVVVGTGLTVQSIGSGLMWGGIFVLATGYFSSSVVLQDWNRFVALLLSFIILIYIGYRKPVDNKGL